MLRIFQIIDTIMAGRQLLNLKRRAELDDGDSVDREARETGARDQFQLYHVIYASGEEAGQAGKEQAAKWRQAAILEGRLDERDEGCAR